MNEYVTGDEGLIALVLHPILRNRRCDNARSPESRLNEAVGLTRAIGLTIGEAQLLRVPRPVAGTLISHSAIEQIDLRLKELEAGLVVIDHPLTPPQQRNLEKAWSVKVIDRTGLILEIFGERARTYEGKLQVELAALSYQRSRLVRSWTHLERQRGGFGFTGGPGESQLEIDRRLIDERIVRIKKNLGEVARTRDINRQARARVPFPVVALVGYTNAGKSTLFNRLAGAATYVQDQLFATLDPTMRAVALPSGRRVILSDTVGFVSDLPHQLVSAFRATLEEVQQADVILHVRDLSHPDTKAQCQDVLRVLEELGIEDDDQRLVEALNKTDLMDSASLGLVAPTTNQALISAKDGTGLDNLSEILDRIFTRDRVSLGIRLNYTEGAAIAWLHAHGEIRERHNIETGLHLIVALTPADYARFCSRFPIE